MNYVYPLGTGTVNDNIELKISLRSVQHHDPECNVFVVGEKPRWASDQLHHMPCEDISKYNKDGCMINKVLHACEFLEGDFVRLSDDQVILNKPDFTPYHTWRISDIVDANPNNKKWFRRAYATSKYLLANGYTDYNFDLHCPVQINSTQYKDTMNKLDKYYLFHDRGYLINSIYFNMIDFDKKEAGPFHVVKIKKALAVGDEYMNAFTFLNFNNPGFTPQLKAYLLNRYSTPSKFEIA